MGQHSRNVSKQALTSPWCKNRLYELMQHVLFDWTKLVFHGILWALKLDTVFAAQEFQFCSHRTPACQCLRFVRPIYHTYVAYFMTRPNIQVNNFSWILMTWNIRRLTDVRTKYFRDQKNTILSACSLLKSVTKTFTLKSTHPNVRLNRGQPDIKIVFLI